MANLGGNFDPNAVPKDDRDFDVLPAGTYEAQIVESEIVPTKAGNGKILKVTWEIIAGKFEKRKAWDNVNIQNQSAQAQEIGQRRLAQMCEATGVGVISDSEALHYKPCLIVLGIEKQEGFEDKNKVSRVKPLGARSNAPQSTGDAVQSGPQTNAAQVQQSQRAAAGARPWAR